MAGHLPRGAHPDDARLFGVEARARLGVALEEVSWLLGRGYPLSTAITTVGNHHQLAARQRLALSRVSGSEAQLRARRARRLEVTALAGAELSVDGFNLVITLEVALSGGPVLRGADGALRDLAGLRGSYAPIEATDAALSLVGDALREAGVRRARWLLDEAVSSSGRLRSRILEKLGGVVEVEATLVRDPDAALAGLPGVVSSDGVVLDRCASWVSLAAWIVERRAPGAWIVDLG